MSPYAFIVVILCVAVVILDVLVLRVLLAAHRAGGFATAYRRLLAARVELLKRRQAALLAELASRRKRGTRTMR